MALPTPSPAPWVQGGILATGSRAKPGTTGTHTSLPTPRKEGAQGGNRPPGTSRWAGTPPLASAITFTLHPEPPPSPCYCLPWGAEPSCSWDPPSPIATGETPSHIPVPTHTGQWEIAPRAELSPRLGSWYPQDLLFPAPPLPTTTPLQWRQRLMAFRIWLCCKERR